MKIKRGQILRDLRTSKRLNQSRLAELLGVSLTAYQKYEHGTAEPNFDNLSKLADFYGVSTDYLLGREPSPPPADAMEVLGIEKSVDDDEFMRLYNELPDYAKQIFVDTMARLSQATQEQPKIKSAEHSTDKPDIQISQIPKRAIARSKDHTYRDAPTPEQIASFMPVPEDSDL